MSSLAPPERNSFKTAQENLNLPQRQPSRAFQPLPASARRFSRSACTRSGFRSQDSGVRISPSPQHLTPSPCSCALTWLAQLSCQRTCSSRLTRKAPEAGWVRRCLPFFQIANFQSEFPGRTASAYKTFAAGYSEGVFPTGQFLRL